MAEPRPPPDFARRPSGHRQKPPGRGLHRICGRPGHASVARPGHFRGASTLRSAGSGFAPAAHRPGPGPTHPRCPHGAGRHLPRNHCARGETLPALPAEAERQRLYQAVSALAAANADSPTLLFVDDAHRLGATALDLLARLTDFFQLLLCYRGEETPHEHPLRQLLGSVTLQLEPLSLASVQALIRQLAGQELPELVTQINAQSGGHPLFVVALLQHLFETGQLYVEAGGGWGQTEELSLALPTTVRAAIETRLQRLNRSPRRIFDFAAVLGGEFDFDLLQAASQQPEETLLAALDELIAAALLSEPRRQGRAEFAVTHERYTEVAYATLPAVRRKQLHRQAAQALETQYAGRLSAYFPALAGHYDKAENYPRAAHYAALAGEQAAAQFANAEAQYYLSRALELTPAEDLAQRVRLLLAREKVYDLQGVRQPQEADLTALEALAPHLPLRQQAEITLRRAAFEWILGHEAAARNRPGKNHPACANRGRPRFRGRGLLTQGPLIPRSGTGPARFGACPVPSTKNRTTRPRR